MPSTIQMLTRIGRCIAGSYPILDRTGRRLASVSLVQHPRSHPFPLSNNTRTSYNTNMRIYSAGSTTHPPVPRSHALPMAEAVLTNLAQTAATLFFMATLGIISIGGEQSHFHWLTIRFATRQENESHKLCLNGVLALCPGHGPARVTCIFVHDDGFPQSCRMQLEFLCFRTSPVQAFNPCWRKYASLPLSYRR